jgi:hypothetical protein
MRRKRRPAVVLVIAILNFVFGGIVVLCGLCAAGGNALTAAWGSSQKGTIGDPVADMTSFLDKEVPGWQVIEVMRGLLLVFLAVILIVAGVGLLKMQNWARWASLFYSVAAGVLSLAYLVYQVGFFLPATEKWEQHSGRKAGLGGGAPNSAAFNAGRYFGAFTRDGIVIAYSITLCVCIFLPHVNEAFNPPRPRRRRVYRDEDDDDERDDYDRDDYERDDEDEGRFRRRRYY